jgi:hypothetical protein
MRRSRSGTELSVLSAGTARGHRTAALANPILSRLVACPCSSGLCSVLLGRSRIEESSPARFLCKPAYLRCPGSSPACRFGGFVLHCGLRFTPSSNQVSVLARVREYRRHRTTYSVHFHLGSGSAGFPTKPIWFSS